MGVQFPTTLAYQPVARRDELHHFLEPPGHGKAIKPELCRVRGGNFCVDARFRLAIGSAARDVGELKQQRIRTRACSFLESGTSYAAA